MKTKTDRRRSDELPQITDLQTWERESQRLLAQEKTIRRQRLKIEKYIVAAKALAKEGLTAPKQHTFKLRTVAKSVLAKARPKPGAKPTVKVKPHPHGTWTKGVLDIVVAAGRPISPGEVKLLAQQTPLAERLKHGDKGFYGAIGKLADRKQIVRHKGHLFSPKVYKEFQRKLSAGLIQDLKQTYGRSHSSPARDAILRFLKANRSGATMGQILAELEKDPDLASAIKRSRNSIYNLVSRLVKRRVLTKKGSIVRYPQQNEALGRTPSASNGSLGGEGGSSPSFGLAATSGAADGD